MTPRVLSLPRRRRRFEVGVAVERRKRRRGEHRAHLGEQHADAAADERADCAPLGHGDVGRADGDANDRQLRGGGGDGGRDKRERRHAQRRRRRREGAQLLLLAGGRRRQHDRAPAAGGGLLELGCVEHGAAPRRRARRAPCWTTAAAGGAAAAARRRGAPPSRTSARPACRSRPSAARPLCARAGRRPAVWRLQAAWRSSRPAAPTRPAPAPPRCGTIGARAAHRRVPPAARRRAALLVEAACFAAESAESGELVRSSAVDTKAETIVGDEDGRKYEQGDAAPRGRRGGRRRRRRRRGISMAEF